MIEDTTWSWCKPYFQSFFSEEALCCDLPPKSLTIVKVNSGIYRISSYLHLYSVSSYLSSVNLYVPSRLTYIQPHLICIGTAQKIIFPFSKCSEKMVFPKKSHWNMIFLVSLGKMAFLFLDNMIFFYGGKWRMVLHGNMMFSVYSERWYLFLQIWNYSSVKKAKIIFSQWKYT